MALPRRTPEDLAKSVAAELERKRRRPPPLGTLTQLFETLYSASLLTEESQPTYCYVVYLDPENPDPAPPEFPRKDRWNCIDLVTRIPFTASSLVKIAKASDPRTSSFAIYHDSRGKLFIWGLVDQGNRYHEYLNHNAIVSPDRPGLLQAAILGIGHIVAYRAYDRIAELHIDTLVTESHDILRYGPVRNLLQPEIDSFIDAVRRAVGDALGASVDQWTPALSDDWIATLCRILLRMKSFRHGGALLITPRISTRMLDIKYPLGYERLRDALFHSATHWVEKSAATDAILPILDDDDDEPIPRGLYLDEAVARIDLDESTNELDGAIWFVSLLSRVDGLVLLTPDLQVKGFGVEILQRKLPTRLLRSSTANATPQSLRVADYQHFGTRHRSMMRYCFSVPGSLGFVVSQDGDVRVMTRLGDALVFWDSIRLQLDNFVRQRSQSQVQRRRRLADEA